MGNRINNKYEYRSGLLDSLNVQHTASDVRNEDEYRKKVLNGLGVEFTDDDINQKSRYRAKVVEGLASSGGSGGSSDFSTATLSIVDEGELRVNLNLATLNERRGFSLGKVPEWGGTDDLTVILYKGTALLGIEEITATNISISGAIEDVGDNTYVITGDCTITLSSKQTPE